MEEEDFYSTESKITENSSAKNEIVAISVDNYKFEEGLVNKHVIYLIRGQDSSGLFEASRRYKEFKALRSILSSMWPACYIPRLPPKKAVVKDI